MKGPSKPILICLILFLSKGILLTRTAADEEKTRIIPVNVGVLVDYELGKIWLSCINMSIIDIYDKNPHFKTRLVLHTRDSTENFLGAALAALELLKDVKVEAILGPTTSMQANLLTELGEKAQVPIVSFSASTPSIKSLYFFQATQNDKTQAKAIAAIIRAFRWRSVVPIYINNEYGVGIIPYLMESLQEIDIHIPYQVAISPSSATDLEILNELYKLKSMPTRVFVLHMSPSLGSRLVRKAKEVGMLNEGYVWILSDGMTNFMNSMDPLVIDSMQGVLGVEPYVPKTKELERFRVRWKRKFHQDHPHVVDAELDVYGQWAYDAAKALAIATEEAAKSVDFQFQKPEVSSNETNLKSTFRVSPVGPELVQALESTSFRGFSGDFRFANRQLQPSAFQIVNLHGERPKRIGLWTPGKGLDKASLGTIIWPGDSVVTPKGWEFQGNGRKLRIGVPSDSFKEFVNVTIDPNTKTPTITGFCISIFDAVMKELPDVVEYKYIPFPDPDSNASGNYDELVYQVYKRLCMIDFQCVLLYSIED